MDKLVLSLVIFSLATGAFAAELPPVNKVIDAAKNINQEIQKKIDAAPVAQEISKILPTEEQAKGFLAGVWKIGMIIVKFVASVFNWILEVISSLFYSALDKIGLDFFKK